ncbi:hypothetical protein HAX54_025833, partial [Datura stramonium]|nr:hypothetical protein [Datura stramonium]
DLTTTCTESLVSDPALDHSLNFMSWVLITVCTTSLWVLPRLVVPLIISEHYPKSLLTSP